MFFRLLWVVLGIFYCGAANANIFDGWIKNRVYDCTISANEVNFGTVADTDLNNLRISTNLQADCHRDVLWTLFPALRGGYCIVIRGGSQTGGDMRVLNRSDGGRGQVFFQFYNPGMEYPIGSTFSDINTVLHGTTRRIMILENAFGFFNMDFPVDVVLKDSRANKGDGSIAGGLYINSFEAEMHYGAMGWDIRNLWWSPNTLDRCTAMPKHISGHFTVKATVKSSCNVSVDGDINFGLMPAYKLTSGLSQIGRVSANCTAGRAYQVGLSDGLHKNKALPGFRAMKRNGSDADQDYIAYNLYQDGGHIREWSDEWGTNGTYKDMGKEGGVNSYTVYAFIPPQATDKHVGVFQDTVQVVIALDAI